MMATHELGSGRRSQRDLVSLILERGALSEEPGGAAAAGPVLAGWSLGCEMSQLC